MGWPAMNVIMSDLPHRMPWSGDPDVMISRFDVRAHLDTLPSVRKEDVSE